MVTGIKYNFIYDDSIRFDDNYYYLRYAAAPGDNSLMQLQYLLNSVIVYASAALVNKKPRSFAL